MAVVAGVLLDDVEQQPSERHQGVRPRTRLGAEIVEGMGGLDFVKGFSTDQAPSCNTMVSRLVP